MLRNLAKIRGYGMDLTDREVSILAAAITEMANAGHSPYEDQLLCQVDARVPNLGFMTLALRTRTSRDPPRSGIPLAACYLASSLVESTLPLANGTS